MVNNVILRRIPFFLLPRGFKCVFLSHCFMILFYLMSLPVAAMAESYFVAPVGTIQDISTLEKLYEKKDRYKNTFSVFVYICMAIPTNTLGGQRAEWLLAQIEKDVLNYDFSHFSADDYCHFLGEKAFYYYLKNDDHMALEVLNKIIIPPNYTVSDFHGAYGVKRNTVTSIIKNCLVQGDILRSLKYFLSTPDIFTSFEKYAGVLILPFFAVKINPTYFPFWIWLIATILFVLLLLYTFYKVIIRWGVPLVKKFQKISNKRVQGAI